MMTSHLIIKEWNAEEWSAAVSAGPAAAPSNTQDLTSLLRLALRAQSRSSIDEMTSSLHAVALVSAGVLARRLRRLTEGIGYRETFHCIAGATWPDAGWKRSRQPRCHFSTARLLLIGIQILAFAVLTAPATSAAPIVFQSAQRQTSLLELYTSEGCSSCPPAEEWLSHLKDSPGLWTDFVPVAFHVDYWNSLGWRDPWSDERYSDRQRDYAQAWKAENIYTPEFVLNGNEWHRGFWSKSVPASSESNAGLLKVTSDDAVRWHLTFTPPPGSEQVFEAHAALLVSGVSSDVTAGENARRHLNHDFVAVAFTEVPVVARSNLFQSTFVLTQPDPKPSGRLALAVWITTVGKSRYLLQAIGGWLPKN